MSRHEVDLEPVGLNVNQAGSCLRSTGLLALGVCQVHIEPDGLSFSLLSFVFSREYVRPLKRV